MSRSPAFPRHSLPVVLLFIATATQAQFPPQRATNLQVIPRDIAMDSLLSTMGGFTRALGVRCSYCHVEKPGQSFEQIDFALDDNPVKAKAREMLRMVSAINGQHLERLSDRRSPAIQVTCVTCHRGVAEPRPLSQVVLNAYVAAGADSAEATYRTLRERYHDRGSYNFGETSLSDAAAAIAQRGNLQDAIRLHSLNVEMNPRSNFALRQLASSHLSARDTGRAILAYQRALQINPGDGQARRALEAITKPR